MMQKIMNELKKYGKETLIFDGCGVLIIIIFQYFFAQTPLLIQSVPPLAAALAVYGAFILIAARLITLFKTARETQSQFLGLLLSGGYALMTIAQPVFVALMMLRFGVLPNEFIFAVSFFVGLAVIFPAMLGYEDEKPVKLFQYFGIAFVGGVILFWGLPLKPDLQSYLAVFFTLLLYSASFGLYSEKFRNYLSGYCNRIILVLRQKQGIKFFAYFLVSLLLWFWWELAIDSVGMVDPKISLGHKLMILYFTGPLLYRLSLIFVPPFSWLKLGSGIVLFIISLYF